MPDLIDPPITDAEFRQICQLVQRHCGICLHDGKRDLVHARLGKLMRSKGLNSFREYQQVIEGDPTGREFSSLIDSLSTNLTSFFREPQHFDFLRNEWLPKRLGAHRQGRSLRAWSAGCSSGEEAYTLAITLSEALKQRDGWDVKILATDLSQRMLTLAETGVYDVTKLAAVPAALRASYFKPFGGAGESYIAGETLKRLIRFRYLNLIQPWPFGGSFDVIFCRNVMIYFDKPTQQQLIASLYDRLAPGGVLFTGHSESLAGLTHSYQYVAPTIYRRPGGRA